MSLTRTNSPRFARFCTRVAGDIQAQPGLKLESRAFRRHVPATADLGEAAPPWAAGAAPSRSFGPFVNPDGRPFWFSFYRTPRLVPVASPGADPRRALLFSGRAFAVCEQLCPAAG